MTYKEHVYKILEELGKNKIIAIARKCDEYGIPWSVQDIFLTKYSCIHITCFNKYEHDIFYEKWGKEAFYDVLEYIEESKKYLDKLNDQSEIKGEHCEKTIRS